jgi:hypothetical protein
MRSFDLVSLRANISFARESGNSALGHDEPASRRECNGRHARKQQLISPILAAPAENPSEKHVPIQQFASLSTMNSLCDGTGNQFVHNRETQFVQQRINSTEQGIVAKSIFARRARTIPHSTCPRRRASRLGARAGALDSRFRAQTRCLRGNDTTLKDIILNDAPHQGNSRPADRGASDKITLPASPAAADRLRRSVRGSSGHSRARCR